MGSKLYRLTATTSRPADNTAYAAGDEVSNSATAGSVVRATFLLPGVRQGRILGCDMDLTPASGNVVITAANFMASVYKSADAPAAVGDNVTNPIAASNMRKSIGNFLFDDGGWMNPLGAFTASTSALQTSPAHTPVPIATPIIAEPYPPGFVFSFQQGETAALVIVLRALAAWTPTGVLNDIAFTLDLELE